MIERLLRGYREAIERREGLRMGRGGGGVIVHILGILCLFAYSFRILE
jgi:hypothetical protein